MVNILSLFRNKQKERLEPKEAPEATPDVACSCDKDAKTTNDLNLGLGTTSDLDEYGVPLKFANDKTYLEIKEVLEEMLQTKEAVKTWLNSSGRGASKTPIEYILEGKLSAARRMVSALEYGILS